MRVTKYTTRLDDARIPMLVREKTVNYQPEESYRVFWGISHHQSGDRNIQL